VLFINHNLTIIFLVSLFCRLCFSNSSCSLYASVFFISGRSSVILFISYASCSALRRCLIILLLLSFIALIFMRYPPDFLLTQKLHPKSCLLGLPQLSTYLIPLIYHVGLHRTVFLLSPHAVKSLNRLLRILKQGFL